MYFGDKVWWNSISLLVFLSQLLPGYSWAQKNLQLISFYSRTKISKTVSPKIFRLSHQCEGIANFWRFGSCAPTQMRKTPPASHLGPEAAVSAGVKTRTKLAPGRPSRALEQARLSAPRAAVSRCSFLMPMFVLPLPSALGTASRSSVPRFLNLYADGFNPASLFLLIFISVLSRGSFFFWTALLSI